jgi:hypothetical protein
MGDYISGLRSSGLERRNLGALVVFTAAVGVASYLGLKTGWGLLEGAGLQNKIKNSWGLLEGLALQSKVGNLKWFN